MSNLQIHAGKTKVIAIKKGPSLSKVDVWHLGNITLETVRSITYLGAIINMTGNWCKHIQQAQIKARKAAFAATTSLFKTFDPPFSLCNTFYTTVVEPTALYGAEVWGVEKREALVGAQSLFWKRIFGISRNAAHCGVLQEIGSTDIRSMACIRSFMYWLRCAKDLAPPLVAACYREQILHGMSWEIIPWALKVKNALQVLGMEEFWYGEGINHPSIYSIIKNKVKEHAHRINLLTCHEKKSLRLCRKESWGTSPYINLCSRQDRSGILWFVLGGWLTYKKHMVDDLGSKYAECVLCGERETSMHILHSCQATARQRARARIPPDMSPDTLHEVTDPAILASVGKFLCHVRDCRSKLLGQSGQDKVDAVRDNNN